MAFIDCNVWEVIKFPRYGRDNDKYTIAEVKYQNSENNVYQSNNFNIQIPEFEIYGTDEQKSFINKYKEILIENRIPVLTCKLNNGMERWVIDLSMADYLLHKITKEK
jgi:hypothetical protein